MYEQFDGQADFYVIYIAEAHSTDEWQVESNEADQVLIEQHTTIDDRLVAAQSCAIGLNLTIPMLIDQMDNRACTVFAAWPERIYIINEAGQIAYKGGYGPFDFDPDEAKIALVNLLA